MEMGRDPHYGPPMCDCCTSSDDAKLVIMPDRSGKVMCRNCRKELRAELDRMDR